MEVPLGHGILGDVSYTDESSAMFYILKWWTKRASKKVRDAVGICGQHCKGSRERFVVEHGGHFCLEQRVQHVIFVEQGSG